MEKGVLSTLALLAGILPGLHSEPVDLADPEPRWATVFEALQEPVAVRSRFEETRSNPFHRLKRRFDGVIRWVPERGLSILYTAPREMVIQVEPDAVFIQRKGEPAREEPLAGEDGVLPMISRLFAWDMEWLGENFETDGEMDPENGWELTFSPVEETLSRMINRMVLEGTGGCLTEITLHVRGGREIEIRLLETTLDPQFTDAELKEAFPAGDD